MGKKLETAQNIDWRSLYILTIVTFLGAFKVGTNASNLWPYITLHDGSITETFYGYMISTSNAANLCAAFAAGFLCNKLESTKQMILSGKVLALLGCIVYLSVELVDTNQRILFFAMEILFGLGLGCSSVTRTYVSMATTEKHKNRAFGMLTLAMTIGHAAGPGVMALMAKLKYPGYELASTGLHLNLYSAPIYFLILTIIVSVVLLVGWFDGKMRLLKNKPLEKEDLSVSEKKVKPVIDPSLLPKNERYDKVAVFVCLCTRFLMTIAMVFGQSLSAPYMMAAFGWSRPQYVFIHSVMHFIIGLIGIGWSIAYISGFMNNRLSNRRAIVIAMCLKLAYFIITYPWPIYEKTIAYEVTSLNETTGKVQILEYGCKQAFDWCQYTPAVNPYVYCIAQVILLGISNPLLHLNLDILYSKVLGQIKQGTMQGVFIICGDILLVIGPVIFTQMYKHYGVKYVWGMIIATMLAILSLWVVFYSRMISSTRRLEQLSAFELGSE